MPQPLKAPSSLIGLRYFVLRYTREGRTYELCLPNNGSTYNLGGDARARAYFQSVDMAALGERAIAAAQSFGASQALIGENRAWGLDLAQIDEQARRADDQLTRARLFGEDDEMDDVMVLNTSGPGATPNENDKVVLA